MTIESTIYEAIVGELERREHPRSQLGMGNPLAKKLAAAAALALAAKGVVDTQVPEHPNYREANRC